VEKLADIYHTHAAHLLHYVYRRVGNLQLAEDIAQTVWLKVCRGTMRDPAAILQPEHWLFVVARHEIAGQFRRGPGRRWNEIDLQEWHVGANNVEQTLLNAALFDGLTEGQRRVMDYVLWGYENKEIGVILEMTEGAVKALRRRAVKTMQKQMAQG